MHYLCFVIVDQPTHEAVAEAMSDYKDDKWDWYRCGGRWDGYLQGPEEEKYRETHRGFNFDSSNNNAARNACKVADLPADKTAHTLVANGTWLSKEHCNAYKNSPHGDYYGAFLPVPDYEKLYRGILEKNKEKFIVVVDAHS